MASGGAIDGRVTVGALGILYMRNCERCEGEETSPACGYCNTCHQYLCRTCYDRHRKEIDHHLIEKQDMFYDKDFEMCSIHGGELFKFYCENHDKILCSVCAVKEARDHQCDVVLISDICTDMTDDEDCDELADLNKRREEATTILGVVEQNKHECKANIHNCHQALITFREELNNVYDKMEKKMRDEIDIIEFGCEATLDLAEIDCTRIIRDIDVLSSEIRTELRSRQNTRLFILMKKTKQKFEDIDHTLERANSDASYTLKTFVPNNELANTTTGADISIGAIMSQDNNTIKPAATSQRELYMPKMHHKASDRDTSDTASIRTDRPSLTSDNIQESGSDLLSSTLSETHTGAAHSDDTKRVLIPVGDANIRHEEDLSTCKIVNAIVLSNGRLVLADAGNQCLKVLDGDNKNVQYCNRLPFCPYSIAELSVRQLAITFPNENLIYTFDIVTGHYLTSVKMSNSCYNLVAVENDQLVYTSVVPARSNRLKQKVYISDNACKSPRLLYTDPTKTTPGEMVEKAIGVSTNKHQNIVYILNKNKHSVIVMNLNRQRLFKLKSETDVTALVVDRLGNAFVSYRNGTMMTRLSSSQKPDQAFSGGVEHKLGVCRDDIFFLVRNGARPDADDIVSIFQLHPNI